MVDSDDGAAQRLLAAVLFFAANLICSHGFRRPASLYRLLLRKQRHASVSSSTEDSDLVLFPTMERRKTAQTAGIQVGLKSAQLDN